MGLQLGNFLFFLLQLTLQILEIPLPLAFQCRQLIPHTGIAISADAVQLVVRLIVALFQRDGLIQKFFQRRNVDPVFGKQPLQIDLRALLVFEHTPQGVTQRLVFQRRQIHAPGMLLQTGLNGLCGLQIASHHLILLQQWRSLAGQIALQLVDGLGQTILFVQDRNTLTPCFQFHHLAMGFFAPLPVHRKAGFLFANLVLQLFLGLLAVDVGFLFHAQGTLGFLIAQQCALHPLLNVMTTQLRRLLQNIQGLTDMAGIFFHAVNGFHQIGHCADGFAQILLFQNFVGHEFVDALDRLVRHEVGKGAGCVLGFAIGHSILATTKQRVQTPQIGALLVIDFHRFLAELPLQQIRQIIQFHDMFAVLVFAHQLIQTQLDAGQQDKQQFILTGLTLLAGGIQMGTHAHQRRKRIALLALAGLERGGQIAVGRIQAGETAVVATEHIGRQRAHLFATTTTLGGFILTRVVVEQVFVGGGHQGLDAVGGGGLARAVAAGKQIHRTEIQFQMGNVAPIHVQHFFQVHAYSPAPVVRVENRLLSSSRCSASAGSISGRLSPRCCSTVSLTKLVMPGRIRNQASGCMASKPCAVCTRRS